MDIQEFAFGDISCCIRKLKLFWLWRKALSCQVVEVKSTGSVEIGTVGGPPSPRNVIIFVDGVEIGRVLSNSTSNTAWMGQLAININAYQSVYVAIYDTVNQIVNITASDALNHIITETHTVNATITTVDITDGILRSGCLSDEKVFNLIGKINNACK